VKRRRTSPQHHIVRTLQRGNYQVKGEQRFFTTFLSEDIFMIKKTLLTTLATIICLPACTPTRINNLPQPISPVTWQHAPDQKTTADLKNWWQGFQDPLLNQLISKALAANHDLKIAKARVREATAMLTVAESALYPSLDFSLSGGRQKQIERIIGVPGQQGIELITPTGDAISGGLTARWEIDVFGSRQLQAEGAAAQVVGAQAATHAVQVGLLAQVATNYLELRGVQERQVILRQNIALQHEQLRAIQAFVNAGLSNASDLAQQETLLHSTEAALPVLATSEASLIHRLSLLLGEPPGKLEPELRKATKPSGASPAIPKLLPADLLEQRPDLLFSKAEVTVAAANLGVAKADLLPKFQLSASGGYGAIAVGGFPSLADSVYTLGSGLSAPIFNAGRIKAQITAADARLTQVANNYEKTFLLALEDVENAFVMHKASLNYQVKLAQAEKSAIATQQALDRLYQQGANQYLSVLDAQHSRLAISDERIKADTAVQVAMVSLYRAFGGGWSPFLNSNSSQSVE
jgi:NodT family efflux transporter outer membrane factor (OMF) lipoprotein